MLVFLLLNAFQVHEHDRDEMKLSMKDLVGLVCKEPELVLIKVERRKGLVYMVQSQEL